MPCYEVDTQPIELLSRRIQDVPPAILDLNPETSILFARTHDPLLREVEDLFIGAFFCFLEIMLSISRTRLRLERTTEMPSRRRDYLEGFFPIYQTASQRAKDQLRSVLHETFEENPALRAAFVAQLVASQTVDEMQVFVVSVPTAVSVTEADEHGDTGKQVTDSIKEFLKGFLRDVGFWKIKLKKENIERGLHVINEILNMVLRGGT